MNHRDEDWLCYAPSPETQGDSHAMSALDRLLTATERAWDDGAIELSRLAIGSGGPFTTPELRATLLRRLRTTNAGHVVHNEDSGLAIGIDRRFLRRARAYASRPEAARALLALPELLVAAKHFRSDTRLRPRVPLAVRRHWFYVNIAIAGEILGLVLLVREDSDGHCWIQAFTAICHVRRPDAPTPRD